MAGVAWHVLLAIGMAFGYVFVCIMHGGTWRDGVVGSMAWHGSVALVRGGMT